MKWFVSLFVLMIFMVSTALAADFSPTKLGISIPGVVQYDFDGTSVDIPVTVSGTSAAGYFVVNTYGQASNIGIIQNGYLGWHYVNGIDTCVYLSSVMEFQIGSNSISWDGKDTDGGMVAAGEYTYYVWAYDNVNSKTLLSNHISTGGWNRSTLVSYDDDGSPLAQPLFYTGVTRYIDDTIGDDGAPFQTVDTCKKWAIGSDPDDEGLLETTTVLNYAVCGGLGFLPTDRSMYFTDNSIDHESKIVRKWQWIPNGESILQTEWGEDGAYEYSSFNEAGWETGPGAHPYNDYVIVGDGDISGGTTVARLFYIDINDGSEIKRLDLTEWWVLDEEGAQASSVANNIEIHHDRMRLHGNTTCQDMLLDPNYEDEEDAVLWANLNGDYVNDVNFEEDNELPWVCADYSGGPWRYNLSMDENLFSGNTVYDLGALSFAQIAPDGTGLGYLTFAGDTAGVKATYKYIDYGSAYDGLMVDNATTGAEGETDGTWWIGSESQNGFITSSPVAVSDGASAFSVSQNNPNPFNPTTTISFSLTAAGNTTIDVFNVAGQKVDMIMSEFVSAGSHSVTWDASSFSAGLYFYTVKSGDFSKTMKMTLLK